ncbi:MAG: molybdopterin-dependent oxidoreductase [Pirellulales bacterium]|nr:molybdopterin-dependent oxidoreductase [Pirellulales bacterium]
MTTSDTLLIIDGAVERPLRLSLADLSALPGQVPDVSQLVSGRQGSAVTLAALLTAAGLRPGAAWLTLHASADDFHASVPLDSVREQGLVVYRLGDQPLPAKAGGPVRFLIPDVAACHTHDVDECANVKFVDRIELSATRGFDNRPEDERAHAALHHRAEQKES